MMQTVKADTADYAGEIADLFDSLNSLGVRYAESELICREGTYAAGIQLILRGTVLETIEAATGGLSGTPELLRPGDVIGVEILLPTRGELHFTTCRSLSEVSLLFLDRTAIKSAQAQEARLSRCLAEHLASRHFRLKRALHRATLSPLARLGALLLDLEPLCTAMTNQDSVALPMEIDWKLLAELARVSPTQARAAYRVLPNLGTSKGRLTFRPIELRAWLSSPSVTASAES